MTVTTTKPPVDTTQDDSTAVRPEPVREPVAGEQQAGEGHEERVEHPLQLPDAGVEVVDRVQSPVEGASAQGWGGAAAVLEQAVIQNPNHTALLGAYSLGLAVPFVLAAVALDDAVADEQPEPRPLRPLRRVKRLEHPLAHLLAHPRARVGEKDLRPIARASADDQ